MALSTSESCLSLPLLHLFFFSAFAPKINAALALKLIFFLLDFSSCWLSLEGGLLYSFVGPAAAVVLVRILTSTSKAITKCILLVNVLPIVTLSYFFLTHKQVNMVIGILVFNKLVSKDGITDVKLKERAG